MHVVYLARRIISEYKLPTRHYYQDDLVTPGIFPASASSRRVMRETPKRRWNPRGRPLSEQRLRIRTLDELRGNFANFFCAEKNSSSVVAGFASVALSSARFCACFSTRRMRFLLRSMAEVLGMSVLEISGAGEPLQLSRGGFRSLGAAKWHPQKLKELASFVVAFGGSYKSNV
jgi:hypothetical protein